MLISISDSRWSTFVDQQTSGWLYYSAPWFKLIMDIYGYTVIPLITTNPQGQVSGFLPLCLVDSPLTGRRLVSLPFSDHCPLLAVDDASANALIDQALRLAQQQRVRYLELRSGVNMVLAKRPDLVEGNSYIRWLIPLTADADALWSGLRKPVQRQIKKSQKLGVRVHFAHRREDVALYYKLHLQTRTKKQGMPAQPQRFFFNLWDTFASNGSMQLLLAEYQGSIIAGMILLASGTDMRYAYGASDERYLHLAPNNLLMWTAISWSHSQGFQTLDLGRTARANHGLIEFKRRWGAYQESLPYYYYPRTAGLASVSEDSWKFRFLTTCWSRLPLEITEPLGGFLYKHLG